MKIVFLGDSLTQGFPGVGCFNVLEEKLVGNELINFGKGGDTVVSLLKRIKLLRLPLDIDIIILAIGVNDEFVNVSKSYPLIKHLMNQPWAGNNLEFKNCYREIVSILYGKTKKLIAIPPLLLGEDPASTWSRKLDILSKIIESVVSEYENSIFLDVRKIYMELLKNRPVSGYIVKNALTVISDTIFLRNPRLVDKKAKKRGLYYTLDGVHLNSTGVQILAGAIMKNI